MGNNPAKGFAVRKARLEDADGVADVVNARTVADIGAPMTSAATLLRDWTAPGNPLDADYRVVETRAGRLAAYMDFGGRAPYRHLELYTSVHPEFTGKGLGKMLLRLGESRAEESAARAPDGEAVGLYSWMWKTNADAIRLHEGMGYRYVRGLYHMLIELEEPPPEPSWPRGITVRTFVQGQDEHATWKVDNEAFRDHWGHEEYSPELWVHELITRNESFDPTLFFLACEGKEVVALVLGKPGTPEDPAMLWVDDVAVLRPWRRRGVALALLHQLFGECFRRGTSRIGLDVDAQNNTGAVHLYEKAGMRVWREAVGYEKRIR